MSVEWPDRRADVLDALELFAGDVRNLDVSTQDGRWPDLMNAVHWLVDDTWWDHRPATESVGTILRNAAEATAVSRVVALVVGLSERQGTSASDAAWFADESWREVQAAAGVALALMRDDA